MSVTATQIKVIATSILTMLWPNVPDTTRIIIVASVVSIYTMANAYFKSRSYGKAVKTAPVTTDSREQS